MPSNTKNNLVQLFDYKCFECDYLQPVRGECHLCGGSTEQISLFSRKPYRSRVTNAPNRIEQNRTEQNGIKKNRTERSRLMKKEKYTLSCPECGSEYGSNEKDTFMVCRKCPGKPILMIQ